MNQYEMDLHIHTYYSDGQASPGAIVSKAKELGYSMIAITDHDGIGGIKEALQAGKKENLKVIPGIELATGTEEGIDFHLLGYDFDIENSKFRAMIEELEEKRQERNHKLVEALNDLGYRLSFDELQRKQPRGYIGKPVIARLLQEKGYIDDYNIAFKDERFFENPHIKAVKKEKLLISEAISVIQQAGGVTVLAHPIQTKKVGKPDSEEFYTNIEDLIKSLTGLGLKGLECYHPDQNGVQTKRFIELANKYELFITRGSDFHGIDFAKAKPTA